MLGRFQSKEAIGRQIREGCRYFLIQEGAGVPAGYFAVRPGKGELFLRKIYVRKDLRRRGYGRAAMALVEDEARRRRCRAISLAVNRNNHPALRAYENMGFRRVDSVVRDIGGGFVMDDYVMEKDVPERKGER